MESLACHVTTAAPFANWESDVDEGSSCSHGSSVTLSVRYDDGAARVRYHNPNLITLHVSPTPQPPAIRRFRSKRSRAGVSRADRKMILKGDDSSTSSASEGTSCCLPVQISPPRISFEVCCLLQLS
jgi:hypothetical protein